MRRCFKGRDMASDCRQLLYKPDDAHLGSRSRRAFVPRVNIRLVWFFQLNSNDAPEIRDIVFPDICQQNAA